ncbi:hypothetical protein CFIO01_07889 [Colletotrichum fioriniae PJ7]|uniref:Uncharacterized protein n=1 Tax=Colletotrichum fioriniae PJ7 TaxID=1445577 RepID=A0A010Q9I9_9PEZI|nr:hypothetical protein CFIO01_07889 [Colletotrichum fioriniae PJ7]
MGNDATVNEIEEVWYFLASVGGALLVILLVRDISQWCRDRLLERRIKSAFVKALIAYRALLKREQILREDILRERREYEKAKQDAWNLFVHKGERIDRDEKAIQKGRKEVNQMRADLEKEKGDVKNMKADVERGLEELRKLRAKIIEKADKNDGSGGKFEDMDDNDRELEQ